MFLGLTGLLEQISLKGLHPVFTWFWCPCLVMPPAPNALMGSAMSIAHVWHFCGICALLGTDAQCCWLIKCLGLSDETIFPLKMKFRNRMSNQCHLVASVIQNQAQ